METDQELEQNNAEDGKRQLILYLGAWESVRSGGDWAPPCSFRQVSPYRKGGLSGTSLLSEGRNSNFIVTSLGFLNNESNSYLKKIQANHFILKLHKDFIAWLGKVLMN